MNFKAILEFVGSKENLFVLSLKQTNKNKLYAVKRTGTVGFPRGKQTKAFLSL